jgi:hypothetical protein
VGSTSLPPGVRLMCARHRALSRRRCKNYAGTSPLTVASGKKRAVLARHVRNRRLYDAVDLWAFCALQTSPGGRIFYDQHRAAGDLHHQALRALGNRLVGILHGCLPPQTQRDPGRLGRPRPWWRLARRGLAAPKVSGGAIDHADPDDVTDLVADGWTRQNGHRAILVLGYRAGR